MAKFEYLNISQINLQHSKSATGELRRLIALKHTNISLIQEPYIYEDKVLGLNNLGRLLYSNKPGRPRACIFVNSDIDATLIPQCTSNDLVAAIIKLVIDGMPKEFVFASVYLPYNSSTPPPGKELEDLVLWCKQRNLPMILGCDANAHHTVWGSTDINARGVSVLEFVGSTDLEILNTGIEPTFINKNRREVIDLTLCSMNVSDYILDWHVSDHILTSDHSCICFRVVSDRPSIRPFRNRKLTNWDTYISVLAGSFGDLRRNINSVEDIEANANVLNNSIITAFETACPERIRCGRRNKPFWNSELKELRRSTRKRKNKAKRSNSQADWDAFTVSQNQYKKALRSAQRVSWRQFCESIETLPEACRLHKAFSRNPSQQIGNLKRSSGEYTTSEKETITHLLEVHFPGGVFHDDSVNSIPFNQSPIQQALDAWEVAEELVTPHKVRWAVESFSPFKSPGPDTVFPALIQKGLSLLIGHLCYIFKACIALGYLPNIWTSSRVVFIPKPGRNDYSDAKAYRPISLTSFFVKTLERLVDRHIRDTNLLINPLHLNQHAYRNGRSCETALHQLVGKIEKAMDSEEWALCTFMDIEGAFDNTSFDSIVRATLDKGVHPTIVRWIDVTLRNRCIKASVGTEAIMISVNRGCPQGGVLSPLLWTMVVDPLLYELNEAGYDTEGYSDDIVTTIIGKFLNTLCDLTQNALKIVERWCLRMGLSVNPNKTELIIFTRKKSLVGFSPPRLFGKSLSLSKEVKYLGVILDSKLNWISHVNNKLQKATNSLWQCRRAIGKSWGLSPKVVYWLYTTIIRPMLSYAAIVWWPRVKLKTVKITLDRFQRLALIAITGAISTTPTIALEILLSLPSLDIYIEGQATSTSYRLHCGGSWRGRGRNIGHAKVLQNAMECMPDLGMISDYVVPSYDFDIPYKVYIPPAESWTSNVPSLPSPESISVYTDGSRNDIGTGFGIFSQDINVSHSATLCSHTSVFCTEVYAVLYCAVLMLNTGLEYKNIHICSDSQATLKALESPRTTSKLIKECRSLLKRLSRNNTVTLIWVPGHCNVAGNERADELARQGSQHVFVGPRPSVGVPISFGKKLIKTNMFDILKERWSLTTTCRQSKMFLVGPDQRGANFLIALQRKDLKAMVSVITGHGSFNKHLTSIGVKNDATCNCCMEAEDTAEHFIRVCPAFHNLRYSIFASQLVSKEELKTLSWKLILKFIRASGKLLT